MLAEYLRVESHTAVKIPSSDTFRRHSFTMPDATLTSQMSALIFKNALLKRRNPRRTVGEVIAIFYFTLIMAFTMVRPMKTSSRDNTPDHPYHYEIDSPPASRTCEIAWRRRRSSAC